MKKSLLFGVLAAFAISAVSVQNLNAQNPVKTTTKTEKKVEKKASSDFSTEKAVKKDGCCAEKKATCDKKKDDCCASKEVDKTSKKKLSVTNGSNQPNAAVKPKPQAQSQTSSSNNANDR